jgi:hypothetical protein
MHKDVGSCNNLMVNDAFFRFNRGELEKVHFLMEWVACLRADWLQLVNSSFVSLPPLTHFESPALSPRSTLPPSSLPTRELIPPQHLRASYHHEQQLISKPIPEPSTQRQNEWQPIDNLLRLNSSLPGSYHHQQPPISHPC